MSGVYFEVHLPVTNYRNIQGKERNDGIEVSSFHFLNPLIYREMCCWKDEILE